MLTLVLDGYRVTTARVPYRIPIEGLTRTKPLRESSTAESGELMNLWIALYIRYI